MEVMADLQPFRFEPERVPDAEDSESENEELNDCLEGTFWCTCERCETMPTQRESVFVAENSKSQKLLPFYFFTFFAQYLIVKHHLEYNIGCIFIFIIYGKNGSLTL